MRLRNSLTTNILIIDCVFEMYNFRVLWKYITILNISSWIEYVCDVWSRFITYWDVLRDFKLKDFTCNSYS